MPRMRRYTLPYAHSRYTSIRVILRGIRLIAAYAYFAIRLFTSYAYLQRSFVIHPFAIQPLSPFAPMVCPKISQEAGLGEMISAAGALTTEPESLQHRVNRGSTALESM